jgi:polyhydroxybutyrate depolymerase
VIGGDHETDVGKGDFFDMLRHSSIQWIQAEIIIFLSIWIVLLDGTSFSCGCAIAKPTYTLGPGDYHRTIEVGGIKRHYLVHTPPTYDRTKATLVVLNFHGGGGNIKTQRNFSQMDITADRAGFIAVYPQGTGPQRRLRLRKGFTWNAGTCCGWAQEHNIDDVGFVSALLDEVERLFNVDPKRVYATGYSNGAIMCYRLACELSDRIAAIAPVSGTMAMTECRPSRPVSIIHFHGTQDKFLPFAGGRGPQSMPGQYFKSVDESLSFWLNFLRIKSKSLKKRRKGDAIDIDYGTGRDGAEVVLWKIEGGGHTWPGGRFGFLGKRVLGKMNTDISATDLMWAFFQRHPMK